MRKKAALLAASAVLFAALAVSGGASPRASGPRHRTAAHTSAETAAHISATTAAPTSAAPMIRLRPGPTPMVRSRGGRRRPAVVVQPRSVTIAAGRLAGFTAAASGNPAPRTQWQRSVNRGRTWTDIPGAHRVTYTFTAKASEAGGEYRAVFTNIAGRATTKAARLTIGRLRSPGSGSTTSPKGGGTGSGSGGSGASGGSGGSGGAPTSPPQIIVQPADQSIQSGDPATFITGATGVVTGTQWQLSTDGGANWGNVPNATATTYAMIATSGENGYEYRAVLSNSAGSATTRAATLTVAGPPGNSAPQVTTQPTNQTVADGDYATFTAAASGSPAPATQWQVSSNGGQTWSAILGANSTSYTFKSTMAENGYEYRAVFTNLAGTATTSAAAVVIASQSDNWSGYFALGQSFSAVTGSWSVPAVTCPAGVTSYSSQWIGIDGAQSQTVEQDGTESDCFGGTPNYDAWYEMYGDNAVNSGYEVELPPGTYPVAPGDAMTASVSLAGSTWTLAINDTTQSWTYSTNIPTPSPGPQQSSAEWIVERPEVGGSLSTLSDFGNAGFTSATATNGSASGPISDFSYQPVQMVGNQVLANPGPLTVGGSAFNVAWNAGS